MDSAQDLSQLQQRLREFREARAWAQFHNPKDLAAAIAIEAAELQEHFLWAREPELTELVEERRDEIEEELADVLISCLNFADCGEIDVLRAIDRKIDLNEANYPIGKSRGTATKHTEL